VRHGTPKQAYKKRHGLSPWFMIKVDTTKAGSASDTFVLPLRNLGGYNYNFTVDWGDLSNEVITNASTGFPNITHVYSSPGIYVISILENVIGGFPQIFFSNTGDKLKIVELMNWGTNR